MSTVLEFEKRFNSEKLAWNILSKFVGLMVFAVPDVAMGKHGLQKGDFTDVNFVIHKLL